MLSRICGRKTQNSSGLITGNSSSRNASEIGLDGTVVGPPMTRAVEDIHLAVRIPRHV
jgi:hypothetical protein